MAVSTVAAAATMDGACNGRYLRAGPRAVDLSRTGKAGWPGPSPSRSGGSGGSKLASGVHAQLRMLRARDPGSRKAQIRVAEGRPYWGPTCCFVRHIWSTGGHPDRGWMTIAGITRPACGKEAVPSALQSPM
jgi:hypothetical protein